MGLLDFDSIEDPRFGALSQLSLGLLGSRKGQGMQALAQGLLGYNQALAASKDQALKRQLLQSQIDETKAQAQQREQAALAAQAQAAREAQFRGALTPQPAQALAGGGGPTLENAARAPRGPDWQALALQFPDKAELIQKLAASSDWGKTKVARTVDTQDAQGRPITIQLDEFGRPVGDGMRQWKPPMPVNQGDRSTFVDPVTLQPINSFAINQSPDSVASNATARRGQDMIEARARATAAQTAAKDAAEAYEYKQDAAGNWIALPKKVNPAAGPIQPVPVTTTNKNAQGSREALSIIDAATPLIDKATSSYIGAGADQLMRAFGQSTKGGDAAAQLKALEGALIMKQPRMEGPQSDKDTALYRQMAGQIGDPTIPADMKKAALSTIRELHQKYAGPQGSQPKGKTVTRTGMLNGRKVVQYSDGTTDYAD